MSGRMLRRVEELTAIAPPLGELLTSSSDLTGLYAGAIWADWTHVASNLKKRENVVDVLTAVLEGLGPLLPSPISPDRLAELRAAVAHIDVGATDKEYEHFVPGLRRYVSLLRGWDTGPGFADPRVLAFLLGMVSHMYQDIVFHFAGATATGADGRESFLGTFETLPGWKDSHGRIELWVDVFDWLGSMLNDAVETQEAFPVRSLYPDFSEFYHLLGSTLHEDTWNLVDSVVRGVQWAGPRLLATTLSSLAKQGLVDAAGKPTKALPETIGSPSGPVLDTIRDLQEVFARGSLLTDYPRGGLTNGAIVTQAGVLTWFARATGWYVFQNEVRSSYLENPSPHPGNSYTIGGRVEYKYLPYLGAADATLSRTHSGDNSGREPLLVLSDPDDRALLRFEIGWIDRIPAAAVLDVDGHERSIPRGRAVDRARLWLYLAGTPAADGAVLRAYRVNRAWAEGLGHTDPTSGEFGTAAGSGEVSYLSARTGQQDWAAAGCDAVPADRDGDPVDSVVLPTGDARWIALDVTAAVQGWVDDPATNHGLLLTLESAPGTDAGPVVLYSSQADESDDASGTGDRAARRPLLVVEPRASWREVSRADPGLSDAGGWNAVQYYSTIRTAVLRRNGEQQLYLLARGAGGVLTWRLDVDRGGWVGAAQVLGLDDASGWIHVRYNSTLTTQVVRQDGEDRLLLLARGAAGVLTWQLDLDRGVWEGVTAQPLNLSGAAGWDQVQYYSTIRTQVVHHAGRDRLLLLARGAAGVLTWQLDLDRREWVGAADPPLGLSDAAGWAHVQYNSTIRTAVLRAAGDEQLLLTARGAAGVQTWRLDLDHGRWEGAGDVLGLSDAQGWDGAPYYSSLRTATIHQKDAQGERDLTYLLARSSTGVELHLWSGTGWELVNDDLRLADSFGWTDEKYYATFRLVTVGEPDEHQLLVLLARRSSGVNTFAYDPGLNVWHQLTDGRPAWRDVSDGDVLSDLPQGWNGHPSYDTIRAVPLRVGTSRGVVLLGRTSTGIETHLLDLGPAPR